MKVTLPHIARPGAAERQARFPGGERWCAELRAGLGRIVVSEMGAPDLPVILV